MPSKNCAVNSKNYAFNNIKYCEFKRGDIECCRYCVSLALTKVDNGLFRPVASMADMAK